MGARRPNLRVIREGNPGHRPLAELEPGVRLKPEAPDEPRWGDVFPPVRGDDDQQAYVKRLRGWSSGAWAEVVPVLDAQGLLATVDGNVLLDHCCAVALAMECIREIATRGLLLEGERGWMKNGATTILRQQRDVLRHTRQQLGLTPVARDQLPAAGRFDHDESSPFD